MRRLRDLIIDGLLLAVPLVVLGLLLSHVIGLIAQALQPVAALAPRQRLWGIAAVDIMALLALVGGLVLVGALSRSGPGKWISQSIEQLVLRKIPGFLLFKSMAAGFSSTERETGFEPALVEFDDHAELGFIVDDDGHSEQIVVFMPSAPTPAAGSVAVVPRTRVRRLHVPAGVAIATVTRLGMGLQSLLQGQARSA
jgi:uncharacterized membrane protein